MIKYFTSSNITQNVYNTSDISCGDGYTIAKGTLIGRVTVSHIYAYVSEYSHYNFYSSTEKAEVWTYYLEPYVIMEPQTVKAKKTDKKGNIKTKDYLVANGFTLLSLQLADERIGDRHECFVADWVPRDIATLDASQTGSRTISATISNDGKEYTKKLATIASDYSAGVEGLSGTLEFISDFVSFVDDTDINNRKYCFTYYFNKTNKLGICSSERAKRIYDKCSTSVGFKWYSRKQKYICTGPDYDPKRTQFTYTGKFEIVDKKNLPKTIWTGYTTGKIDFSNK